jgi:diadenosine tetraphosphate (Ap4A) HIT family hydrolase
MDCFYCGLNAAEEESEHFIRFFQTSDVMIYLHRDQSLPGRFVVATRAHFNDVTEIPEKIYWEFCLLAHRFGRAAKITFPETLKINWALCGNAPESHHPHLHILPRHVGDRRWPDFFLDYVDDYWPQGDPRYYTVIEKLIANSS